MKAKFKIISLLLSFLLVFVAIGSPVYAEALPNTILIFMQRGQDVKQVQVVLNKLGYNLSIDGSYGPATRAAVLSFQKKYSNLSNDGSYGPKTKAVMRKALKGNSSDNNGANHENNYNLPNTTLRFMQRGQAVKQVQIALNKLGYNLSTDGSYGPATRAAVLKFQRQYTNLSNDGSYGPKTRAVMTKALKGDTNDQDNNDKPTGKIAYLTFDDGPSNTVTPKILNTLNNYNIKATFFILGNMAEKNPSMINRIKANGHSLGNHTYSHKYDYIYANQNNFLGEINKTENILKNILGKNYKTRLIRFPGGSFETYKKPFRNVVRNKGYKIYDWNALNGDSEARKVSVNKQISRLEETVRGQKELIVLMHDSNGKETTAKALPQIIKHLKNQGYTFRKLLE